MTTPEHEEAERLLAAAREFEDAAAVVSSQSVQRRREAVLAAREAGMSLVEIGRALGVSHARVTQIIKNTR